jgi:hypothetical protein
MVELVPAKVPMSVRYISRQDCEAQRSAHNAHRGYNFLLLSVGTWVLVIWRLTHEHLRRGRRA